MTADRLSDLPAVGFNATADDATGGNTSRAERRAAKIGEIKGRLEARRDERMAQWQQKHDALIAKLTEKLATSKKLTTAEQEEIVTFFEDQYQANVAFRNQQYEENMKFLDTLMGETDLAKADLQAKIKAQVDAQKAEDQAHRANQQAERKAEREKIKAERPDNAAGN